MNCGLLWDFFTDSVIPVFIAVGSVYCAEYFARKRDYKQKKIEIQIDYMRKEINYLAEMEYDMMLVSRKVDSSLGKHEDREKQCNEIIGELSKFNEKNLASYYMLDSFNKSMGIDIDIQKYKEVIGNYADNILEIYKNNVEKPVDDRTNEEINRSKADAVEVIHDAIKLITEKMADMLKE